MHEKFWKNEYKVGDNEAVLELNDIKKVEFDLENSKCYFVLSNDADDKFEVSFEDAMIAIQSNKIWRPV